MLNSHKHHTTRNNHAAILQAMTFQQKLPIPDQVMNSDKASRQVIIKSHKDLMKSLIQLVLKKCDATNNYARLQQRKPPLPPLPNPEAVEETTIIQIALKIHLKQKVEQGNILRNTLMQHKAHNQQFALLFPRIPTTGLPPPNSKRWKVTNSHLSMVALHTIVNSSLTVLTILLDDHKVKAETRQNVVHHGAESSSIYA